MTLSTSAEANASTIALRTATRPHGLIYRTFARLLHDPGGIFGLAIVVSLIILALAAPLVAPFDPYAIGADIPFAEPSIDHWFGTDNLGRDVLSRVLFGGRISLTVSILSAAVALLIAIPLGMLAGYAGGTVDAIIARIFDTIFAFPGVLIGIGLAAALGGSMTNVIVAVGIINVPTLGRLARVAVLAQRNEEYVEAARSLGASAFRVVARHILPNIIPPLLVQTTIVMADAVLLEAAFSFLGLGIKPPTPSWGTMLNEGRNYLAQGPWLGLFPGLAITIMVLGLNALGDALRVALNPSRR